MKTSHCLFKVGGAKLMLLNERLNVWSVELWSHKCIIFTFIFRGRKVLKNAFRQLKALNNFFTPKAFIKYAGSFRSLLDECSRLSLF